MSSTTTKTKTTLEGEGEGERSKGKKKKRGRGVAAVAVVAEHVADASWREEGVQIVACNVAESGLNACSMWYVTVMSAAVCDCVLFMRQLFFVTRLKGTD